MSALQEVKHLMHYLSDREVPDQIDAQIELLAKAALKAAREGSFAASHDVDVAARIMRGGRGQGS